MKQTTKWVTILVVVLALAAVAAAGYRWLGDRYGTGRQAVRLSEQTAPDFSMLDAEGNAVRLSDCFGKPIVLNFWASWCPPCRAELPAFDALYAEYGDRVQFLMVDLTDGSRETQADAAAFIREQGYRFPVYYDTKLEGMQAYQLSAIPVTILIGADGAQAASHSGAMDEETLRGYLELLTAGK